MGRDFAQGEDLQGAPRTILLSDAIWRNQYGAKPDILGQTITLDGLPHVVIGVLPRGFYFAPTPRADYWEPLRSTGPCEQRRSCHNLYGLARLQDGVALGTALADTQIIARRLEQQYPQSNRGQGANVVLLTDVIAGEIRPTLLLLLSGAALLLLIACINVASLLLVRSESRRREMAIRGALGASRGRLLRQFMAEALLLVAIGGLFGIASAASIVRILSRLVPTRMPFFRDLTLNAHVWEFACAVALLASLLFAVTPTLRVSLRELHEGLAEASRGSVVPRTSVCVFCQQIY